MMIPFLLLIGIARGTGHYFAHPRSSSWGNPVVYDIVCEDLNFVVRETDLVPENSCCLKKFFGGHVYDISDADQANIHITCMPESDYIDGYSRLLEQMPHLEVVEGKIKIYDAQMNIVAESDFRKISNKRSNYIKNHDTNSFQTIEQVLKSGLFSSQSTLEPTDDSDTVERLTRKYFRSN